MANQLEKPKAMTEKKFFICNLLAQYKTAPEIQTLVKDVHSDEVSRNSIYSLKKAHPQLIEKLRTKYLSDLTSVPIAQEKVRLERDEILYQLSLTIENESDRVDAALHCLKEAREETKSSTQTQNNYIQFNQFNSLTDEELLEKKHQLEAKIINIKSEVVSGEIVCK